MDQDRCWICLCKPDEPPPPGSSDHNWKRPCKCNMIAHEACLLDWANEATSNSTTSSNTAKLTCPQCKSTIRIVKTNKSVLLRIRDFVERTNKTGFQLLFFSSIGGSAIGTVYSALYTIGATTIRFICPTNMALDILGIVVRSDGIQMLPPSWRKILLIPIIPIALVFSGSRSKPIDLISLLLPLTLASRDQYLPWMYKGPKLTLALLPVARIVYQRVYDSFVDPLILSCASTVRPSFPPSDANEQLGLNMNIQVVVNNENDDPQQLPQDNMPAGQNGGDPDFPNDIQNGNLPGDFVDDDLEDEGLINRMLLRGLDWAINFIDPPPQQQQQQPQIDGQAEHVRLREDERQQDHQNQERLPGLGQIQELGQNGDLAQLDQPVPGRRRPHAGDWVISSRSATLRLGHVLLWPLLGGALGSALSSVPFVRKAVPDRFNRNILGAALVVVTRDLVNIATALIRTKEENSRKVLNYYE